MLKVSRTGKHGMLEASNKAGSEAMKTSNRASKNKRDAKTDHDTKRGSYARIKQAQGA